MSTGSTSHLGANRSFLPCSFRREARTCWFAVRMRRGALVPAVRSIVHDLDASLALYSVQSMDDLREQSMAKARFLAILLLVFATIGVILSIVGVYGVLAHVSRNRTREMGIRIALGARAGQVRWLVIQQGVRLAVIGLGVGVVVALFATRGMSKLLFGVAPNDPVTLIAVVVGLAMTSALASWLPAVRAQVEPIRRLRCARTDRRSSSRMTIDVRHTAR